MTWSGHAGAIVPVAIQLPAGSRRGWAIAGYMRNSDDAVHFYRLFTYLLFLDIASKDEQYDSCMVISDIVRHLYKVAP